MVKELIEKYYGQRVLIIFESKESPENLRQRGFHRILVNGKEALSADIIEIIRNFIERAKTYPLLARKRGIEGTVYISFSINSEGKPHDIKVLKSSGYNILDTATLDIVKKAAPFPPHK